MEAIKKFLKNFPGTTEVVKESYYTPQSPKHKKVIQLVITQKAYILNVFIPFLESLS